MRKCIGFVALLLPFICVCQQFTKSQYQQDFDLFFSTIKQDYCYWDKKKIDWQKAKSIYQQQLDTITYSRSFVQLLERAFHELYDHHASLSTNTSDSYRLVPSGADLWAEYVKNKPVITEVRAGFGTEKAGITAGLQVIAINDVPIEKAVQEMLPKSVISPDTEAKNYALRLLLAGKHSETRKMTLLDGPTQKVYYPDTPINLLKTHAYEKVIEVNNFGNVGYIKINNRLWDNAMIQQFDSALNTLMQTKALILDLRETPSGGNTTVARSIIGRFISKEGFYQKHVLTAEERTYGVKRSWIEIVSPRGKTYTKPLIILCNHWTGSVGEGITIGFHALKRATIIGTRMAGLNGAIYSYKMPNTGIGFSIPVEKLFHVNGMPRENFVPDIMVDLTNQQPQKDQILNQAIDNLNRIK
jgi:C-terminal processing protease CtpA/Prc